MTLEDLIKGRGFRLSATAMVATSATNTGPNLVSVASVATVAVAHTTDATTGRAPWDRESWEERAAVAEFDGGLSREAAEALAWHEDDMRRFGCTAGSRTFRRSDS